MELNGCACIAAHTELLQGQRVAVDNSYFVYKIRQNILLVKFVNQSSIGFYMHFIHPMHLQDCDVSHQHQQVACAGETHSRVS